jgi:hypothetical protein
MATPQSDISSRAQRNQSTVQSRLQNQLENEIREFKAKAAERPFVYLAIAFIAGLVSWTYPVRLVFRILTKLTSLCLGPAFLLIGILRVSEFFAAARGRAG